MLPFPYRSSLKTLNAGLMAAEKIPLYRAKKQRKLTLHHVHGPNSWMIDFMQLEDNLHVLNLVHCNSRYWLPTLTLNENAQTVINSLRALVSLQLPIDTLISDAAKTFTSTHLVNDYCKELHIKQIAYDMTNGGMQVLPFMRAPTTSQYHNQLAIIDRISRTLRDMIFNVQRSMPSFVLDAMSLKELARVYNRTPHETLSKTMGFNVTPTDVIKLRKLQDEIVRRWLQHNELLMESQAFTSIRPFMKVYVYQPKSPFNKRRNTVEDSPYIVLSCNRGNFIIERVSDGQRRIVQRKDITF